MAFQSSQRNSGAPLAEINMIPLIDVMLVLLVIFMITAPLLTHSVKIDLPHASSHANIQSDAHISLAIDRTGRFYWNGEATDRQTLLTRMSIAAKQQPQPELHLSADLATPYQTLAEVMAAASRTGLVRMAFVSDPGVE
ncbi:MAG TPA: biopolymer transporter ExbD [Burkholderiales bacterium]|nr:biopolymer transporter ExbD [Burkholderiales bacterium]